jgi:hypothetical protein
MLTRIGSLLGAGLLASACLTTRAATPIERPALEVPPVPPRVVEAAPAPDLGGLEPIADLPPERPATPTAKPRPGNRDTAANRDPQKTEKPPEPAPPAVEPAVAVSPQPAVPPPLIRTPATADAAAAERQIRDTINRAQGSLKKVNFQGLTKELQKAYNDVKDFIERAEAAIKASNFELAKGLASNAEKLASELPGR